MKYTRAFVFFPLVLLGTSSLSAEDGPKLADNRTTSERVSFVPGGTIRVDHSYGELNIQGWDRPEVEVTVIKTLFRFGDTKAQAHDDQRLESIRINTERKSATELRIETTLASRHGKWIPPLLRTTTNGVTVEYEIHVPRDSKLVIHHGTGSVSVSDVAGDIEAHCARGDILLWLPPGAYSINARTKFGLVSSDMAGSGRNRYLIGEGFTRDAPPPSHRLYLRMGFGGITIKGILPESEAPNAP